VVDLSGAGLPAPSKVRFKFFTLDHRLVHVEIGQLSATDAAAVRQRLAQLPGRLP
jgi:mRNA interferase MazF